jgi:hypothetical protein
MSRGYTAASTPVPGLLLLRSAALVALIATASLPAFTVAIAAGTDVLAADRVANVVRGGAIIVLALGLHPLLPFARHWAMAITSIGVLGGLLAAFGNGSMLALDLLATDQETGLGLAWPTSRVLRDVAWVLQGGWLLAVGRASRGARPLNVDAGRVASVAGAGMVLGASHRLMTNLRPGGGPTAVESTASIALTLLALLAAVVAVAAMIVWLLHVAQLTRGPDTRGRVGRARVSASRPPGLLLATAFVTGVVALILIISVSAMRLGLVALPVASGAAMIALHQRLHVTMLGARVVTAGGLLGATMMMMEPTLFIGLAIVGTWLLLVGWLGWRRLLLDRPAGVLAIIAGCSFVVIGLFGLEHQLMIGAVVVGPIGLVSLVVWLGRAWALVRAEDLPAHGALERPRGNTAA